MQNGIFSLNHRSAKYLRVKLKTFRDTTKPYGTVLIVSKLFILQTFCGMSRKSTFNTDIINSYKDQVLNRKQNSGVKSSLGTNKNTSLYHIEMRILTEMKEFRI